MKSCCGMPRKSFACSVRGADEKTRVRDDTQDVLLYAYAVSGIEREDQQRGLTIAAETPVKFGGGRIECISVSDYLQ